MKRTCLIALCLLGLLLASCGGKGGADLKEETSSIDTMADISINASSAEASIGSSEEESKVDKDDIVIGTEELSPPNINLSGYVVDTENLKLLEGVHVEVIGYTGNATKLIIPSKINGKPVKRIFSESFLGHTRLEGIYIEDGIEEISLKAFYKCINLKEIRLPNTLKTIGSNAFYECINLKELYVPDSVTLISSDAFYSCSDLKRVRLPADIKNIYSCFRDCTALSGTAIIPAGGTKITSVYSGCKGIKTLIIKGGQVLDDDVFEGMTGLEEIHIPESVIEFEDIDKLFKDQIRLKKIYVVDGSYAAYVLADSVWGMYLCSEVVYEE